MKATIDVEPLQDGQYRVTVTEGDGQTSHTVTADPDYAAELTAGNATTEDLLHHSFEFLLEREPKESILRRFDLPLIGHYFPEYEREIRSRLTG